MRVTEAQKQRGVEPYVLDKRKLATKECNERALAILERELKCYKDPTHTSLKWYREAKTNNRICRSCYDKQTIEIAKETGIVCNIDPTHETSRWYTDPDEEDKKICRRCYYDQNKIPKEKLVKKCATVGCEEIAKKRLFRGEAYCNRHYTMNYRIKKPEKSEKLGIKLPEALMDACN